MATLDDPLKHPNWISFLHGFPSGPVYKNRLESFMEYFNVHCEGETMSESARHYLEVHREMLNDKNEIMYKSSTLQSWFSMLKKFFEVTGRGNLDALEPLIQSHLKKWRKQDTKTKAFAFDEEDLRRFYEMENTPDTIVRKFYSVIAKSFAGRGVECVDLQFENLKNIKIEGKDYFIVEYQRAKQSDATEITKISGSIISGDQELEIVNTYNNIAGNEKHGRIFRKIIVDSTGNMRLHKQPIGRNVLAKYGVDIAKWLCLDNPERYTGHCWRSTSITMLVNKGFTKEQIKRVTGAHFKQIISTHTFL
jgi:hypothetical protein